VYIIQNINYNKKRGSGIAKRRSKNWSKVDLRGKANLEKKPNQCVFLLAKLIVL
jgi:hypothetical protein